MATTDVPAAAAARETIAAGRAALGIELGSTRIKACLIDAGRPDRVLAIGSHEWQNTFAEGRWTYPLDEVWSGVRAAYGALADAVERDHGIRPRTLAAVGVSAMMHGYLAFDADDELLVPFRTWRNTSTGPAADELTELFGVNIPQRWSVAHLRQAMLDREPHLARLAHLTTLAGHVHHRLTGRRALGVGDASGVFPIDEATGDYDARMLAAFDGLGADPHPGFRLADLLPEVLSAGAEAGTLTAEGAALLDEHGVLEPGAPFCPPEGDAGTGMVATGSVAPRTGNVSVGTSTFAMIVLEERMRALHREIDLVTTPAGRPVAMVHCNNGASELAEWAALFTDFAGRIGTPLDSDAAFAALLAAASEADADAGGVLAYNQVSGEPVAGLADGRPLVVRPPDGSLTLANLVRAHLDGVFAALALGMGILAGDGVRVERMLAHGGLFRTAGVAQRALAAALDAPVSIASTASEGGAWGIAVLAAYRATVAGASDAGDGAGAPTLEDYLARMVFGDAAFETVAPDADEVAAFARYLDRYRAGLELERAASDAVPLRGEAR